jgi:hypothetical protein
VIREGGEGEGRWQGGCFASSRVGDMMIAPTCKHILCVGGGARWGQGCEQGEGGGRLAGGGRGCGYSYCTLGSDPAAANY